MKRNFEKLKILIAHFKKKLVNKNKTVNKRRISRKGHTLFRVRDHDHLTSEFRVAARVACNLNARSSYKCFMPTFSHNVSRFDSTFFVSSIRELIQEEPKIKKIKVKRKAKKNCNYLVIEGLMIL